MEQFIYILVFIYTLSIIFYMADLINIDYKYELWGYRLLFLGGTFHFIVFIINVIQGNHFYLATFFGVLFFYSLILVFSVIILHQFLKWKLLELITIFLIQIILIGAVSIGKSLPTISNELISKLLYVHITITIISYSFFSISAIFAILYLLQYYLLKRKIWNRFTRALPSLESLERYMYLTALVGVPILFLGLTLGFSIDLYLQWISILDPKVITSFFILFMYSRYILKRYKKTWYKKDLAIWNIASFIIVLLNLIIINNLDSFHKWF